MRAALASVLIASCVWAQSFHPSVPKSWVDAEIADLELSLAHRNATPKHVPADYYYRMPVRTIYKSYPVYALDLEPAGYMDWLKSQAPQVAFDPAVLKSEDDWIRAGETVFEAPKRLELVTPQSFIRSREWSARIGTVVGRDGVNPFFRYFVREKGKVELGIRSCAMCHTRILPDGTVLKGGQGNFPFDRHTALQIVQAKPTAERVHRSEMVFFGAPWIRLEPALKWGTATVQEIIEMYAAIPPGVAARRGASNRFPVQIPDLIGVRDRKYLDHSGLQLHRSAVDLMRYAAINQDVDLLSSFDGFIPGAPDFKTRPEPTTGDRYSDEQLYALALYLYSLQPPVNPNKPSALSALGKKVFQREGCGGCHTPPLYTNNKLTPATGFQVPEEHKTKYDILPVPVGTDPGLTLQTRRGTGYYKVPSLKGVWYRGPFEHSGSVMTLDDWFDPNRLRDDYVPTGFKGLSQTRAVKGHEFGLKLAAGDKAALIAFLKTL